MKKITTLLALGATALLALQLASCKTGTVTDAPESEAAAQDTIVRDGTDALPTDTLNIAEGAFHKSYIVACVDDHSHVYKEKVDPAKALVVISKREYRLYVYEAAADTTLAATFPVCYALNTGQKTKDGDSCTPECTMANPFHVSEINNAAAWTFDFDDGRGPILAFGKWFIRLDLSQSFPDNPLVAKNRSIGIHGSTGNERSIPGRDSHGCVRLRDADLVLLHDNYVAKGTTVVIKPFDTGKLPFELKAEKALGEQYIPARLRPEQ